MDYPDIIEYLNGHSTSVEKKALEQWVADDPRHKITFERIKKIWLEAQTRAEEEKVDVPKAWQKVAGQIQAKDIPKINWQRRWTGIAAVLLIGIMAYISREVWLPNQMQTAIADHAHTPTKVVLGDGSVVWLNQHSKLIFPKKFSRKERHVKLEGQAFFDIQRNEQKPFKITAGGAEVEVLGTSFDVMAFPDSSLVRVQVSSGKVAFYDSNDRILLVNGEEGFFDKNLNTISKTRKVLANQTSWKTKILKFDDANTNEAIKLLEQVFRVNIQLENQNIGNCRFTSTFDNENLSDILETISALFNLDWEQKTNKEYILKGQGCSADQ